MNKGCNIQSKLRTLKSVWLKKAWFQLISALFLSENERGDPQHILIIQLSSLEKFTYPYTCLSLSTRPQDQITCTGYIIGLCLYFDFFVSPVRGQRCLAISSCLVSNSIFLTYFRDRVSKTSQNMGNSKKSCSEHPTKDLLPIFWIFGGMVVFLAILFYRV